ncbi:hypothetical protein [Enterovibrio sp. 27052020O]|uniref:hypothetical protein n=1 Tax=Enterovibrio sp. 27052020O TaxID=3241166 RepID=UPI003890A262
MVPTRLLFGYVLFAMSLIGCSSQPEPLKTIQLYSKKEVIQLAYCTELADNAYFIASEKLKQRPKQVLIERYASDPSAQIKVNAVERIYNTDFDSAWNYAVNLFSQCALKVAEIAPQRQEIARFCAQKAIVAGGAYDLKQRGTPKLDAYIAFASYKQTRPYEVIDAVYDSSAKSHLNTSQNTWDQCIDVMSE